jgi:hypothetical protein
MYHSFDKRSLANFIDYVFVSTIDYSRLYFDAVFSFKLMLCFALISKCFAACLGHGLLAILRSSCLGLILIY